ncbi:hypothetical protein [Roseospirillum parvum]|uniref:Uncharacterized protein n=1 Tax=Roseospirillum parvum TaxID=83401 RepID=A0A1G7U616_9PROT|nr:hypothetical protein [Roseospirillum parvum]SDG42808.1 hypothetical protein SAMN05421742_101218 [Roseospirillum parvum]
MRRRVSPSRAAVVAGLLAVVAPLAAAPAVAGSGQEIQAPPNGAPPTPGDCRGRPCGPQGGGQGGAAGGQASGPATDTTGGTEGTFADFER